MRVVGAPSLYTTDLAKEICDRIASGETLVEICDMDHMPDISTLMEWASGETQTAKEDNFPEKYARARAAKIERMSEELQSIADDASNDWMDRQFGEATERVLDHEHVTRSKLRIDTRKWLLSKMRPDIYGDRLSHQMLDEHGKPARAGITVIVDGAPAASED